MARVANARGVSLGAMPAAKTQYRTLLTVKYPPPLTGNQLQSTSLSADTAKGYESPRSPWPRKMPRASVAICDETEMVELQIPTSN